MNIKFSKKEKILIVFYLVMIFFLGLGITFSFFLLAASAEEDSTRLYAGRLDINYIQGNEVNVKPLQPIPEPGFNETENIYINKFFVKSDGTLEQNVQIGFDVFSNQFSKDMIRFKLYTGEGEELSTGYLNEGYEVLIDNMYFEPVEQREFALYLWLEEKPFDQSQEMENKLIGTIRVKAKQYGY